VLNYNYQSFAGDLRPVDIADQLQRTIDHVVPYDARVLASMNTGTPQILQARRWHKFGQALLGMVDDIDVASAGADGAPPPSGLVAGLLRKA
jgi:septum formation inhibitor-activating ATPase MinD